MSRTLYDIIGLAAGIAFILALKGLSHPKTARRGNLIGAFGAGLATLVVFFYASPNVPGKPEASLPLNNLGWILAAIAVGLIIGVPAARRVQMTQMPQLVALFNGVGGGAAALPSAPPIPSPPSISTQQNNTSQSTSFDETGKRIGGDSEKQMTPVIQVKATVGVDEVSSKTNRVETLEKQSTF